MRIAICGNTFQSRHLASIRELMQELSGRGVDLCVERSFYDYLAEALRDGMLFCTPVAGDDFEADMAFSIGGDGTFLRTAQWVGEKEIPIIGINTGHLGYLADGVMSGNGDRNVYGGAQRGGDTEAGHRFYDRHGREGRRSYFGQLSW